MTKSSLARRPRNAHKQAVGPAPLSGPATLFPKGNAMTGPLLPFAFVPLALPVGVAAPPWPGHAREPRAASTKGRELTGPARPPPPPPPSNKPGTRPPTPAPPPPPPPTPPQGNT